MIAGFRRFRLFIEGGALPRLRRGHAASVGTGSERHAMLAEQAKHAPAQAIPNRGQRVCDIRQLSPNRGQMVYDICQQFKQLSHGNCHDAAEQQQESSHHSKLAELAERYSGETEQCRDNASDEQQEDDDFHLPVTSLSSTIHCILRIVTPKDTLKG
jgi:hypothetical protein